MKVSELIAALQAMPQDEVVLIPGQEGDMTEAKAPEVRIANKQTDVPWYYGDWVEEKAMGQRVVYIGGERHGA